MSTVTRVRTLPFQAHGEFLAEWQVTGVGRPASVVAAITEVDGGGQPFLGAARMTVHNVAPRDNGELHLWCQVEWPVDISVRLDVLIVNN